jgi:AcrR family transcriptional regulator
MDAMAGRRRARKEMTRRLLLSAALERFNEKGYAATTIDEIAAAAGTTRVTFYAYFPSRWTTWQETGPPADGTPTSPRC